MKARSLILTHVQMPFLLAGLPPIIALGLFTLGLCVVTVGIVLGWAGTGFFGGVGLMVLGWVCVQIRLRRDLHIFNLSWRSSAFWRGDRQRRVFVAGTRPYKKRGTRP